MSETKVFTTDGDIAFEYYETTDLDKFHVPPWQRDTKPSTVKSLANSYLKDKYYLTIALVDRTGAIHDGQTRWAALKYLRDNKKINLEEYPFRYVICDSMNVKTCMTLNSHSVNWSFHDYIKAGAEDEENANRQSYRELRELCSDYKDFAVETLIASLCLNEWNHARRNEIVKSGQFTFVRSRKEVEDDLTILSRFKDVKDRFKDFECGAQAIIFVIKFLDKDSNTLHRRLEGVKKTDGILKTSVLKEIINTMESLYYQGKRHKHKEPLDWTSIFDLYKKGHTLEYIYGMANGSNSVVVEANKAPEPDPDPNPEPGQSALKAPKPTKKEEPVPIQKSTDKMMTVKDVSTTPSKKSASLKSTSSVATGLVDAKTIFQAMKKSDH